MCIKIVSTSNLFFFSVFPCLHPEYTWGHTYEGAEKVSRKHTKFLKLEKKF